MVNGVVGFAGLPVTIATLARRQATRPGQQGEPDRRRSGRAAAAGDAGRRAGPRRQRALRDPPVPALVGGRRPRGRPVAAHRQRRAVPRPHAPPTWPTSRVEPRRSPIRRGRWARRSPIDSSTLMNKGLEVIEAHELFGVPYDADRGRRPPAVDRPLDGRVHATASTIAQLSLPDMRLPIGYALGWPDRIETPFGRIDWARLSRLDFEPPGPRRRSAASTSPTQAGRAGGTAPAVAQRGQRGGGRGVPRRADPLAADRRRVQCRCWTGMILACRRRSTT